MINFPTVYTEQTLKPYGRFHGIELSNNSIDESLSVTSRFIPKDWEIDCRFIRMGFGPISTNNIIVDAFYENIKKFNVYNFDSYMEDMNHHIQNEGASQLYSGGIWVNNSIVALECHFTSGFNSLFFKKDVGKLMLVLAYNKIWYHNRSCFYKDNGSVYDIPLDNLKWQGTPRIISLCGKIKEI